MDAHQLGGDADDVHRPGRIAAQLSAHDVCPGYLDVSAATCAGFPSAGLPSVVGLILICLGLASSAFGIDRRRMPSSKLADAASLLRLRGRLRLREKEPR